MWRCLVSRCQSARSSGRSRCFSSADSFSRFHVARTVQEALSNHEPVVALESTIVAHGMPYPQNLTVAQDVESILRSKGVTPATIAVKNGTCHVGLSSEELKDLAQAGRDNRAVKCSTRDLPLIMANSRESRKDNLWGATTVASTMVLAHKAGISSFVTGGIGGVHRNGHVSMDVSADLKEMSRTPVVVVSAGIKSILDIGRTLEVLETLGVPTVTLRSDVFPAFFSPHSGIRTPSRVEDALQVAQAYYAAGELGLQHGMVVAVPNSDAAGDNVERAIHDALARADVENVQGSDVTPFVLKHVAEQTHGDSLRSNMALVRQNARVGADIAIEIAKLATSSTKPIFPVTQSLIKKDVQPSSLTQLPKSKVLVLGGCVVDLVAKPSEGQELVMGTSNPGTCFESDGGVGRNIAEVLGLLGNSPVLHSVVGNDSRGQSILNRMRQESYVVGSDETIRVLENQSTATYLAILDGSGEMKTAVADMAILDRIETPTEEAMMDAQYLVMDANPSVEVLTQTATIADSMNVSVCFEPTSVSKAAKVAGCRDLLSRIKYLFPNVDELIAIANGPVDRKDKGKETKIMDSETLKLAVSQVLRNMHPEEAYLVVTMGKDGVLLASRSEPSSFPHFTHFAAAEVDLENCTGAGDTFCGAFIHSLLAGKDLKEAVSFGMDAAAVSLRCGERAISLELPVLLESC